MRRQRCGVVEGRSAGVDASNPKQYLREFAAAATAIACGLVLLAIPPPAAAATTCAFAGSTLTVSMSAVNDTASLSVGTGANVGGSCSAAATCGVSPNFATTINTNMIVINGNTGAEPVDARPERRAVCARAYRRGPGTSEIEFEIDLGNGVLDRLTIRAASANETITFGTLGAGLNSDTRRGRDAGGRRAGDGERRRRCGHRFGCRRRDHRRAVDAPVDAERRQRCRYPHRAATRTTRSPAAPATARWRAAQATTRSPAAPTTTR